MKKIETENRDVGSSSAPAKIILFGEHFVVYGKPAILACINRRINVRAAKLKQRKIIINSDAGGSAVFDSDGRFELIRGDGKSRQFLDPIFKLISNAISQRKEAIYGIKVDIKSKIPYGMGLGSSAASCVATVAAVDSLFHRPDKKWVCRNAIESEKAIHKNSSGADCYVSTYGGLIHYSKADGFSKIKPKNGLSFIVADTGIKHSTGSLVNSVKKFMEADQIRFTKISQQAEDICKDAAKALASADKDKIGHMMNENHKLLKQIGVSHEKIEHLIEICNGEGALGSKLTGAGGGGAVIALASNEKDMQRIMSKIKSKGYGCFDAQIDCKGLIVH